MQSIEPAKPKENTAIALTKKISFFAAFVALGATGAFMLEILRSVAGVYCMAIPVAHIWNSAGRSQFVGIATIVLLGIIYDVFFSVVHYYFIKKTSEVARTWQLNGAKALAIGGTLPILFFAILLWSANFNIYLSALFLAPFLCIISQWFAVYKINKRANAHAVPAPIATLAIAKGNLPALESNLDQFENAISSEQMNLLARTSLESYGLKIPTDDKADMVPVLLDVLLKHKRFEAAEVISKKHLELHDESKLE